MKIVKKCDYFHHHDDKLVSEFVIRKTACEETLKTTTVTKCWCYNMCHHYHLICSSPRQYLINAIPMQEGMRRKQNIIQF